MNHSPNQILTAIKHNNRNVRMEALKAIAHSGDILPFVDVVLTAALEAHESDRNVRMEAIKVICDPLVDALWGRERLETFVRKIMDMDADLPAQREAAQSLRILYPDLFADMQKKIDAVNEKISEELGKLFAQCGRVETDLGTITHVGGPPMDQFRALTEPTALRLGASVFRVWPHNPAR